MPGCAQEKTELNPNTVLQAQDGILSVREQGSPKKESIVHGKHNLCFFFQGTLVLPNLHSVVYDSEHWATPWKFNPNNFLDLDGNFVNKEAFLPFSAGNALTFEYFCSLCLAARLKTLFLNSEILKTYFYKNVFDTKI